jgi:hypothetical protein
MVQGHELIYNSRNFKNGINYLASALLMEIYNSRNFGNEINFVVAPTTYQSTTVEILETR